MVTEEMLINDSHKNFTSILPNSYKSFQISTISGIQPNYLPLSSLTLGWTWNICDIFVQSTILRAML